MRAAIVLFVSCLLAVAVATTFATTATFCPAGPSVVTENRFFPANTPVDFTEIASGTIAGEFFTTGPAGAFSNVWIGLARTNESTSGTVELWTTNAAGDPDQVVAVIGEITSPTGPADWEFVEVVNTDEFLLLEAYTGYYLVLRSTNTSAGLRWASSSDNGVSIAEGTSGYKWAFTDSIFGVEFISTDTNDGSTGFYQINRCQDVPNVSQCPFGVRNVVDNSAYPASTNNITKYTEGKAQAESFSTGGLPVSVSKVAVVLRGEFAGRVQAEIWSDNGAGEGLNLPATLIATFVPYFAPFGASSFRVRFFPNAPITLAADTTYWFVLRTLEGSIQWAYSSGLGSSPVSEGTYGNRYAIFDANTEGIWTGGADEDQISFFRIESCQPAVQPDFCETESKAVVDTFSFPRYTPNYDFNNNVDETIAELFVTGPKGSVTVSSVQLLLGKAVGTGSLELWSDNGAGQDASEPEALLATIGSIKTPDTQSVVVVYAHDASIILEPSTAYWLVIKTATGIIQTTYTAGVGLSESSGVIGNRYASKDTPDAAWESDSNNNEVLIFAINSCGTSAPCDTPTPTPAPTTCRVRSR